MPRALEAVRDAYNATNPTLRNLGWGAWLATAAVSLPFAIIPAAVVVGGAALGDAVAYGVNRSRENERLRQEAIDAALAQKAAEEEDQRLRAEMAAEAEREKKEREEAERLRAEQEAQAKAREAEEIAKRPPPPTTEEIIDEMTEELERDLAKIDAMPTDDKSKKILKVRRERRFNREAQAIMEGTDEE